MKKILLIIFMVGVMFSGCTEDFLELYPTTEIDENAAFSNQENAMAVLYGIYDALTESTLLGSFVHITNEVRGDDAFLAQALNWSWWTDTFHYTYTASNTDFRGPRGYWDELYSVIENCNAAIHAELPFVDEALDEYLSELYMMRATAYYNLVNLYCQAYTAPGGPSSPGVPLYEVSDAGTYLGRGTVQDVYDLILTDLEFALQNAALQNNESSKTRFTRCYANGLSARVALSMGNFADAYDYAVIAIADAPDLATGSDYAMGFSDDNEESIFVVPFNSDDYPIYWALSSFYDHPEGYGNIFFTEVLFDSYADDDVRKDWFVTPLFYNIGDEDVNDFYGDDMYISYHWDGYYSYAVTEAYGFYNAGSYDVDDFYELHYRPGHYSLYAKFPRMNASPGVSNGAVGLARPTLMRTSEMYLIKAECEARGEGGGESAAQQTLLDIQQRAQASAVLSTNTGQDLLDEVLMERRKELAGEGFRMFDILRLGIPLERPNIIGPNWANVMTLPAYDEKMIFPIPEAELDSNTELTDADQNPGYSGA
ncbi:MAG: RagB/SusD family nutrient uptake outer membrane protein [Bacteroidota bacterium]